MSRPLTSIAFHAGIKRKLVDLMCAVWAMSATVNAVADTTCAPRLWPKDSAIYRQDIHLSPALAENLRAAVKSASADSPQPVRTITSAGVTNADDEGLQASRRAFRNADSVAILALDYRIHATNERLQQAAQYLLAWATTHVPTGQPIDETRLDGFVWAYDLLRCQLDRDTKDVVEHWLSTMQTKKNNYVFGPKTEHNNHHTHQLKMQLLLDRALDDQAGFAAHTAEARAHIAKNIDAASGESLDYRERDAMHYQVYNLDAWLEIVLISGCCAHEVDAAFNFFLQHVKVDDIHHEFANSSAPIDQKREAGGFAYAKRNSSYNVGKAAHAIVSYYSLRTETPNPELWNIVTLPAQRDLRVSFALLRRELWTQH